jgi:hypothetical protein
MSAERRGRRHALDRAASRGHLEHTWAADCWVEAAGFSTRSSERVGLSPGCFCSQEGLCCHQRTLQALL